MTLDLKLCAELLELDGKRTPGDWRPLLGHAQHPSVSSGSGSICTTTTRATKPTPRTSEQASNDAAFIAAAPKLAEQLKAALVEREQLLSRNRKLHDALHAARDFVDRYYDYQHPQGNEQALNLVDEALSETEATR